MFAHCPPGPSAQARDEISRLYQHITTPAAAERVWQRLLTSDQRELGGDFGASFESLGTLGIWRAHHPGSRSRAVVELAAKLRLIDEPQRDWLLRELGYEQPQPARIEALRPSWDEDRGELRVGNELVRRVKMLAAPSNLQLILDVFEEEGWPARIDSPLSPHVNVHQTVNWLNKRLRMIRFCVTAGGEAITWSLNSQSAPTPLR